MYFYSTFAKLQKKVYRKSIYYHKNTFYDHIWKYGNEQAMCIKNKFLLFSLLKQVFKCYF